LRESYIRLEKRAMEVLIPFATTYLCESGFSIIVTIKKSKSAGCPT
jgi:hypothetical protein